MDMGNTEEIQVNVLLRSIDLWEQVCFGYHESWGALKAELTAVGKLIEKNGCSCSSTCERCPASQEQCSACQEQCLACQIGKILQS
jgi:hypothetical protein